MRFSFKSWVVLSAFVLAFVFVPASHAQLNSVNQTVALKNRRTAHPKERGRDSPNRSGITLPHRLAGLEFQANQLSLRTESVTPACSQ